MTDASAFVLDGAAIADEVLARVAEEARALIARGRDAGACGRSGRRQSGKPELMSRARAGRPRRAASIRSSTICRPRRAKRSCWRSSRRSTPIPRCTASSCNCRCPSTSTRRGCWRRSRPHKDVDGFHPINVGLLSIGDTRRALVPCTPAGAMILIDKACERLGWSASGHGGGGHRPLEHRRQADGAAPARAPLHGDHRPFAHARSALPSRAAPTSWSPPSASRRWCGRTGSSPARS